MTSTAQFTKVIRLGQTKECDRRRPQTKRRFVDVFCKIEIANGKLSISGVCWGSCGQINIGTDASDFEEFAPQWDKAKVDKFFAVWERWHLNDMRAGSPAQEAFLRENPISFEYPQSHYNCAKMALAEAGLQPDTGHINRDGKPYSYGSSWLYEELPAEIIAWLEALPSTDKTPAWV